jgi:hypothetical protein
MNTEILPFTFPTTGQPVRTVTIDGEPWFVARDVTEILGIANGRDALSRVNEADKGVGTTDTPGGPQQTTLVNESGLYDLVLESRKPEARVFRRWVTSELLPATRKAREVEARDLKPMRIDLTINALAELAYTEHVVSFAGRALSLHRWRKPRKGMEAFVQLTLDLNLPGIDGGTASVSALPGGSR